MPIAKPISGEMYRLPISMKPPMLGANTVLQRQGKSHTFRGKMFLCFKFCDSTYISPRQYIIIPTKHPTIK